MDTPKKKIKVSIILDYHLLNKIFNYLNIKNSTKSTADDFPQIDFLNKLKMPISLLGIFLSREEYDGFLKPFISTKEHQIEFEHFVKGLLNREGNNKRLFLRSSFLENINEDSAIFLKNTFYQSGFSFDFNIMVESPISLFSKDFFSLYYQIPTKFKFGKPESFFQNIFKEKMQKVISGLKTLSKVFGQNNISYIYNENLPLKNSTECKIFSFYKEIGIENFFLNSKKEERFEINPLFLEYVRCKLLEGDVDIHKEVLETKEIAKKFKLKNQFSYKDISGESAKELEKFSHELLNFLPDDQKPIKNFLFIKTETCSLKHIIPYVKHKA
jgi:hypothetical protein